MVEKEKLISIHFQVTPAVHADYVKRKGKVSFLKAMALGIDVAENSQ